MSSCENPAAASLSKPRKGFNCAFCRTPTLSSAYSFNMAATHLHFGLLLLPRLELRPHRAVQPRRGQAHARRVVRALRARDRVPLLLLERLEPRVQVRPVREQPAGVDEAQPVVLQRRPRVAHLSAPSARRARAHTQRARPTHLALHVAHGVVLRDGQMQVLEALREAYHERLRPPR